MRWIASTVLASIVLAGAGVVGSAALATPDPPPGDTIVEVTGDAANGFEIRHYDGTEDFPPTDSEARAECAEYDTRVDRVRCRVQVRTWYRDLGDLEQALGWAHSQ